MSAFLLGSDCSRDELQQQQQQHSTKHFGVFRRTRMLGAGCDNAPCDVRCLVIAANKELLKTMRFIWEDGA